MHGCITSPSGPDRREQKCSPSTNPCWAAGRTQMCIRDRCPNGGWAYSYNNKINPDIDLSVTGWNVQALKACLLYTSKHVTFTGVQNRDAACRKPEVSAGSGAYGHPCRRKC